MDAERSDQDRATEGLNGAVPAFSGEPSNPQEQDWLVERIRRQPGGRLLLRLDDETDVSGHLAMEDPTLVRVVVQDDELDTAGHAINLRLPSAEEANAFRRRLLLTGVLVGTIVLGGAGAIVAVSQDASRAPAQASGQIDDVSYEDTTPYSEMV